MNEPQCQKKRVDWSEWASWTYGYECLARMKELAFSFWKATQNLITRTFHYLHFNNKKAFIKAKSNETALKYLPILVLLFCVFVFSVLWLWLCHKGFVLSMPEVQRESIHRRARGQRATLDDKIPTTCWNSTFLPAGWPLVFWMLALPGG